MNKTPESTGDSNARRQAKLSSEQIKNWKRAFPELTFMSDDQIEAVRNSLQLHFGTIEAVASAKLACPQSEAASALSRENQ